MNLFPDIVKGIRGFWYPLLLDKNSYHRISGIILPSENITAHIDHIIISVYGVFVVETINMRGCISGSPDQHTWTQKLYRQTNKFQNPLQQNYEHVKTLQSILGLKDNQIHSVVAFDRNSKFKTDMPENVTRGSGFIRFIKSKTQQVLTELDVMDIKIKIIELRLERSLEIKKKYVENVKNIICEKEKKETPAYPNYARSMVFKK